MYVYLEPHGGLNDILCVIINTLNYCKKYNRKLLLNTTNSAYKINFSDYFSLPKFNIICDKNEILKICNNKLNVYPSCFNENNVKITDIINGLCNFYYTKDGFKYKNTILQLPNNNIHEDIIVYSACGGGNGYILFKCLNFCSDIKKMCKHRYNLLKKPYLGIQVRNTDRKCDYKKLYYTNKGLIHSYNNIYLATDDKDVIEFFKLNKLNIINFTTFDNNSLNKNKNLHYSNVSSHTKIIDVICDLYIMALCDNLLSNSEGGFIHLARDCNAHKYDIIKQFN